MSRQASAPTDVGSTYRCAPHVVWTRDVDRVLLVDSEGERAWELDGLEAAIWDWLAMGYPYDKVVDFVSLVLACSQDEAGKTLEAALDAWRQAGLVERVGED
jgi:hypothetical protein